MFGLGIFLPFAATADTNQPNIIFILADDLGWNGIGCQGNTDVSTPNIDRLAAQGMRFTHAYAEPQCSPTRAALLSGQWGARTGVHKVINEKNPSFAPLIPAPMSELPPETGNMAAVLRTAGYATGLSGKWHVADGAFAAALTNRPGYFDAYGFDYVGNCLSTNTEPDKSVNAITDDILTFIEANKAHPFFAYVAHYAPHAPMEAPQSLIDKYVARGFKKSSSPGGKFSEIPTADYYAMIEHLDEGVGRLLDKLDELGIASNTVVIFTSDNGGMNRVANMAPKRMAKGASYEGGVSVPLVVRWPGRVQAGSVCDTPTHTIDWYPTFSAVAGGVVPGGHTLDGQSILPLLTQSGTLSRDALYWHVPSYTANYGRTPCSFMIKDGWKLIYYFGDFLDVTGKTPPDNNVPYGALVLGARTELYNLNEDPYETTDLAAAQPVKANELYAALQVWWIDTGAKFPTTNPKFDLAKWWQTSADQDLFRLDGGYSLSVASSFVDAEGAATLPGINDVVVWGYLTGVSRPLAYLASDASWRGIRIGADVVRDINITTNGIAQPTLALGSAGIDMSVASKNLAITPNVLLGVAQTWDIAGARSLNVTGAVSGAAGNMLTKAGSGILLLAGKNNYSGSTTISAGTLCANSDGALGAGSVTVGNDGALVLQTGALNNYIYDRARLVLGTNAALTLNYIGSDAISGLSLDNGVTWLPAGNYDAATLSTLGAGTYTGVGSLTVWPQQDILRGDSVSDLSVAAAWTNVETGLAQLPGTNDVAFWGGKLSNSGRAAAPLTADASWLGIRVGSSVINRDVVIATNGITQTTLTLGSAGIDMSSAIKNLAITPNVVLGAAQSWDVADFRTLSVIGALSGAVGSTLTKFGPGTLILTGNNTYSGATTVATGSLIGNADHILSGTTNITVAAGATLTLQSGVVNDYINDSAALKLAAGSVLNLNFAGEDTVGSLSLDGGTTWLPSGAYDAAALDALGFGTCTGSGSLTVMVGLCTLTGIAAGNGTVSPASTNVLSGSSANFAVTASDYYRIASLATNGTFVDLPFDNNSTTANFIWSNIQSTGTLVAAFTAQATTNPANTPYWWLAQYGLTNFDSDAMADADGDGLLAWQEYIAGTNPSNPASSLQITSGGASPQGTVIRWPSVSNRFYNLSHTTNLMEAFSILEGAGNLFATPPENVYTNPVQTDGASFYRINVHE